MGLINPIGGMRSTQPMSSAKAVHTLSVDILGILKEMGIKDIRAIRLHPGVSGAFAVNEMATITLSHDQRNALQGLGLHGLLVAIFSEEEEGISGRYKEKLEALHEHLLGTETIELLKEVFGWSTTPILMEDDHHNGVLFLQQSITQLREEIAAS